MVALLNQLRRDQPVKHRGAHQIVRPISPNSTWRQAQAIFLPPSLRPTPWCTAVIVLHREKPRLVPEAGFAVLTTYQRRNLDMRDACRSARTLVLHTLADLATTYSPAS